MEEDSPGPGIAAMSSGLPSRVLGDVAARSVFRAYFPSTVHFFLNRGLANEDAEDLAQEVLIKILRNLHLYRQEASLDTWVFAIVRNTWKNFLRSQGARKEQVSKLPIEELSEHEIHGSVVAAMPGPDGKNPDPLQKVLMDERTSLLLEAIEQLPPKMRQCVYLRVEHGFKYREIADLMGVSLATAKTQLVTAYRRLRPLLEKNSEIFERPRGLRK